MASSMKLSHRTPTPTRILRSLHSRSVVFPNNIKKLASLNTRVETTGFHNTKTVKNLLVEVGTAAIAFRTAELKMCLLSHWQSSWIDGVKRKTTFVSSFLTKRCQTARENKRCFPGSTTTGRSFRRSKFYNRSGKLINENWISIIFHDFLFQP